VRGHPAARQCLQKLPAVLRAIPCNSARLALGASRRSFRNKRLSFADIGSCPALGPADMQAPSGEVDVVPAQRHQLRGPEAVALSDQDSRGVAIPRAVLLGGLDEPLDLPIGEIFTAPLTNRYIYRGWSRFAKPQFSMGTAPRLFIQSRPTAQISVFSRRHQSPPAFVKK
jgi:hypothetical protein